MTTIDTQLCHAEGSPEGGGRFAARRNSPPGGALAESVTGSFAFPPNGFESADECIEFFESEPISDRILSNADHAYRAWRADQISAEVQEAYRVYGNDPRIVARAKKNVITSDREAREFVVDARLAAAEKYPMQQIPPARMRLVLRAHQLVRYRGLLESDDDQARVLQHTLMLRGEPATVDEISRAHRTSEWADRAMTDSDLVVADAMERVALTLGDRD